MTVPTAPRAARARIWAVLPYEGWWQRWFARTPFTVNAPARRQQATERVVNLTDRKEEDANLGAGVAPTVPLPFESSRAGAAAPSPAAPVPVMRAGSAVLPTVESALATSTNKTAPAE